MSEELQQKLRDQLWEVANKLRGNMSASDFMYFTLGFIFYKYLSEKIEKHANDALVDDDVTFKELWAMEKDTDIEELQESVKTECIENIGYFIEPNFLFSSIIESIKKKENILPILERSLKRIEDSTLGQDIDLASPKLGKTADDKNTLVSNVLLALDDIDFGIEASQEIDILGDAYEYMISQFAAGAGKKAGEFYTPQEVSRILAEIVTLGHARLRNVYDPTCGSGSLLLRAASIGHANEIFGQEKNPTTYNLARMICSFMASNSATSVLRMATHSKPMPLVTLSLMPLLLTLRSLQSGVLLISSTMMTVSARQDGLLHARQLIMRSSSTCFIT